MKKKDILKLLDLAQEITDEWLKDTTLEFEPELRKLIFVETYKHLLANRGRIL